MFSLMHHHQDQEEEEEEARQDQTGHFFYSDTNFLKYKTCYKEYTKVHTLTPTSIYINQKGFSGKNHHLITDLYIFRL